ncbi:UNVERIFIED_ORG: hypothetical protein LHJ69_10285 [Shinella sp. XGS7]|nr:hypothetical protein [Shinella sp. XGS7]
MTALSRHAGAFVLRVESEPRLRAAAAGLLILTAAALLAWLASHSAVAHPPWLPVWAWWGLALPTLPLAAWLGWRLPAHPPLQLHWDGQAWWLGSPRPGSRPEQPVRLRVALDFEHWLLLQVRQPGRWDPGRYIALSRASQPLHWGALRATLHLAAQHPDLDDEASPHA